MRESFGRNTIMTTHLTARSFIENLPSESEEGRNLTKANRKCREKNPGLSSLSRSE